MLGILRLTEAIARTKILGGAIKFVVPLATKILKFALHSNLGLIGLSALAARIGM
jgi:hypothetical protein